MNKRILHCKLPDAGNEHMQGSPENVISCLSNEKKGLKKAMLEVVATGQVITPTDIITYIKCTLLAKQQPPVNFGVHNYWTLSFEPMLMQAEVLRAAKEALTWLTQEKMLAVKNDEWYPRPFGKATMASGIDLTVSVRLKEVCYQLRALTLLD